MYFKHLYYLLLLAFLPLLSSANQIDQQVDCETDSTFLKYGQYAICQIDDDVDKEKFTFTANVGELIYVRVAKVGGGYSPYTEVYSPTNIKLKTMQTGNAEGASRDLFFTAVESGTFTINVTDRVSGMFRVQVDSPASALDDTLLNYGEKFQNTMDFYGDRDYFALNMAANSTVSFTLKKASALYRPTIRVFSPTNVDLISAFTGNAPGVSVSYDLTVYQSGVYVIEVIDTAEGVYEITTECISGSCPNGPGVAQPTLDYMLGMNYCRNNPAECGITKTYEGGMADCKADPIACGVAVPTVNADFSITLPLATFGKDEKLKANLRYTGDLTWELKDFEFLK